MILLLKVAVVYAMSGAESLAAGVLYGAGMLVPLFASAGVAAYLGRNKGLPARIGIYLLVLLGYLMWITMLGEAAEGLAGAAGAPDWIAIEVPIAVAGAAWLWAGYYIRSRTVARDPTGSAAPTSGKQSPSHQL